MCFVIMLSGDCPAYAVSTGFAVVDGSGTGLLNTNTITVVCAAGYTGDAGDGTVTCTSGAWTVPVLTCTGILRFALVNIEHVIT
jgi:hypothetical protein